MDAKESTSLDDDDSGDDAEFADAQSLPTKGVLAATPPDYPLAPRPVIPDDPP